MDERYPRTTAHRGLPLLRITNALSALAPRGVRRPVPPPHAASDAFSPDYFVARERFRKSADAVGARLETHPIAARGPGGEELTIDAAYWGADQPRRMLVLSSG